MLRQALKAIGVPDPDQLDTHSFRRGVVSTLDRNGVGDGVGMRYTGHETRSIYQGYQRNALGDDMHEVARTVHDARARYRSKRAPLVPPQPPHEPQGALSAGRALAPSTQSTTNW